MAISRRVKTVREHVKAENAGDLGSALATFKHPRYEYVATDEVCDGPEEVVAHWRELNRPSPISRPRSSSCAGPSSRSSCFEGDKLICERVYFDRATVLRQLGVARDSLSLTGRLQTLVGHPWTIGRGMVRRVIGR